MSNASEEYQPLMRFLLSYMGMNYLNPLKYNLKTKILNAIGIFMLAFYVIWYFLGIVSNWEDVNSISEANLIPAGILGCLKAATFTYYRKNLKHALTLLKDFWPPNKFPEHEKKLLKIHRIAFITVVTFMISAYVVSLSAMFSPFIMNKSNELPIRIYPICDLETSPCYELLYGYLLIYCYYQFMPIHLCFDGFFVAAIVYGYVGMEMIKISLSKLDLERSSESEALAKLSEIISQHDLILRFIKEVRHVFMLPLLGFFSLTSSTEIVAFYMLTADGIPPDVGHIIQYGSIIIIFFIQMLYYCIWAAIIKDQIQSVGNAIYNVNWYCKTNSSVRKYLAFMIQRTQLDESFTVGNMTKLNLETFVMMSRNIFSFYTLLSETSKKNENM